jgi:hypothetical protein
MKNNNTMDNASKLKGWWLNHDVAVWEQDREIEIAVTQVNSVEAFQRALAGEWPEIVNERKVVRTFAEWLDQWSEEIEDGFREVHRRFMETAAEKDKVGFGTWRQINREALEKTLRETYEKNELEGRAIGTENGGGVK